MLPSPTQRRRVVVFLSGLLGVVPLSTACSNGSGSGTDGRDADAERGGVVTVHPGTATNGDQGGCSDERSNDAAPPQHVDPGTEMSYAGVPPVSGKHWAKWPDITKTLYVVDERPELGQLVHAEEHGWTMVWYDQSIASDDSAMEALRAVADDVESADLTKVVLLPWTRQDGQSFPDDRHVAFTHWGAEGDGTEWRQFCDAPDAGAVVAFSGRHPASDSREPNGP